MLLMYIKYYKTTFIKEYSFAYKESAFVFLGYDEHEK